MSGAMTLTEILENKINAILRKIEGILVDLDQTKAVIKTSKAERPILQVNAINLVPT